MNIFSLFSGKSDVAEQTRITTSPLTHQKESYLQQEISSLKDYVRELDRKDRVSKSQRQELLARVFTTLDLAEKALEMNNDTRA
jgi:hypothetical protein